MARRRNLSWSQAVADFKADRAVRTQVREERLRPTAGLRGSPVVALSAWRGRSGRRYVVSIRDLATFEDADEAVLIAVVRDASGIAQIIRAAVDLATTDAPAWLDAARSAGATEIHVHRLATSAAERIAVVRDLGVVASLEIA